MVRSAKDFFKPLAVGAPEPLREIPVRPSRVIHFFPPSNEKMVGKVPDIAPTVDILLGNLEDGVPADTLERERRIFSEQAAESGKPAEIIEKMVTGRVAKFLKEITLVGQPFVKDPDKTVAKLLKEASAEVTFFVRYEVGEGIEKRQENFADEVMSQARGG